MKLFDTTESIQMHEEYVLKLSIDDFKLKYYFNDLYMRFLDRLEKDQTLFWAFRERAIELRNAGNRCHSAMTILGSLRYESALRADSEGYKINNNDAKPLSLLLEMYDNSFAGFFKHRKPKGQQKLTVVKITDNVPFGNDC
jgi:hypothetical protein